MTLEHAPAHRRGFYASFTLSGKQVGFMLATLVFIPVSALPEADLMSWGWRIPFLLSAVVVVVGLWIRRSLPEAPRFADNTPADGVWPSLYGGMFSTRVRLSGMAIGTQIGFHSGRCSLHQRCPHV